MTKANDKSRNNAVYKLQIWLNQHGQEIQVDGVGGPQTRNAIIECFRNTNAPAIIEIQKIRLAAGLGGSVEQLNAVSRVEAPRGGWDASGLLACLYERHYGWRRWRIKIPFLSDPTPGGYTTDANRDGINDSWEKVADAACRFGEVAFECASFGKFQIMGAWWERLGHKSVLEFVWALSQSEYNHYVALSSYIKEFNLTQAFRKISPNPRDCVAFARGYNGSNYTKYGYDRKIAAAMSAELA